MINTIQNYQLLPKINNNNLQLTVPPAQTNNNQFQAPLIKPTKIKIHKPHYMI